MDTLQNMHKCFEVLFKNRSRITDFSKVELCVGQMSQSWPILGERCHVLPEEHIITIFFHADSIMPGLKLLVHGLGRKKWAELKELEMKN